MFLLGFSRVKGRLKVHFFKMRNKMDLCIVRKVVKICSLSWCSLGFSITRNRVELKN